MEMNILTNTTKTKKTPDDATTLGGISEYRI
jgi:hypothetical protein